jgi:uncharacterized damage-inducible protein DinB
MSHSYLHVLIEHQYWADQKLIEALLKLEEIPDKSKKLMNHIIGAQENWIARIEGRVSQLSIWPEIESKNWHDWISKNYDGLKLICSDEQHATKRITYSNSTGKQFGNSISEILLHLTMHSQYHRGQAITYARDVFEVPPSTDMIVYLRTKSNEL